MAEKSFWGKLWYFIWEDDSIWSWLLNIVIAFVLIKFIIYPGLAFALQTSHPIVAVVSGSMEHKSVPICSNYDVSGRMCLGYSQGTYQICGKEVNVRQHYNFDGYWDECGLFYQTQVGITKEQFQEFPMRNGFNKGDIMILYSAKDAKVGDVIVYQGDLFPIIHRVVKMEGDGQSRTIVTKGDHNGSPDAKAVSDKQVIGKAVFRIPYLGYVKIWAVEFVCLFNSNLSSCGI